MKNVCFVTMFAFSVLSIVAYADGTYTVAPCSESDEIPGGAKKITDSKGALVGGATVSIQKDAVKLDSLLLCTKRTDKASEFGFSTPEISFGEESIDLSALIRLIRRDGTKTVFNLKGSSCLNDDEKYVLPRSKITASASVDKENEKRYNIKMDVKLLVADLAEWDGEGKMTLDETFEGTIYLKL